MRIAINGTGIAGSTLAFWLHRFGHEPVLFERAPALRNLSAALLSACRGVPTHFGVSIVGIDHDGDGVTVTLSDQRRERFDFVVGADGLHSQVRQLAFGADARFERPLGCHVAAFRMAGYPRRDELTYVLAGELHRAAGQIATARAAYGAQLRAFVAAKQKAALRLRRFFAPHTALALWARNVAVRALAVPVLGSHILARSLRDDFVLPDYPA